MIKYAPFAITVLLAACGPAYYEYQASLPPELSDCKVYVTVINGDPTSVVRCPNSSTTTTGKMQQRVIVIEQDHLASVETLKAEARAKALAKLTPAEREVLGLK